MSSNDDIDQRYKDLVAACWSIYANEDAAAARISMLLEVYPEFAMRKLREEPEFFGSLRREHINLRDGRDSALATTALIIRERARDFQEAVEEQALADPELEREFPERKRKRRRERER